MNSAPAGRHVQSLNGTWAIAPGSAEAPREAWGATIPVPSLVDCADPAYEWISSPYHWYRRTFRADPHPAGENATIRIGQAMFGTEVWLNGIHIGGDIACYTSQEYDARASLRMEGPNELIVRVGLKETLPPESAVGSDQERKTFIPGIWGDVTLIRTGNPGVALVQVIPRISDSAAEVRVTLRNTAPAPRAVTLRSRILEHASRRQAGNFLEVPCTADAGAESVHPLRHAIKPLSLWSPDHPFLYDHSVEVLVNGEVTDAHVTRFGMREFAVRDGGFFLNGERIFLRGGNIAFHRFLSDADRGLLPWNMDWVRNLLVVIPKAHNFNFFRAHIGQMYAPWYDIADEGGMLLQNEWMFWTATGTESQITKEFTRWLQDNWNHPSIIMWDPLNESTDSVVQDVVVPKMKTLDPTRPWESVDVCEEHPYIYSLGPVLTAERFGFARGILEIGESAGPVMLNEFLWWWLDRDNKATSLTQEVIERWLGPRWTSGDLIAHQSFLASELIELFRRMRVDAIQPFVYLSNSAGPTGHWFLGDIARLVPKPLLSTLKNAFAPFGVSVEMWDRHFLPGETRSVRLFVFNDEPASREGILRYGIVRGGDVRVHEASARVHVDASGVTIEPVEITFPDEPGEYAIVAELSGPRGIVSVSRKIAHVCEPVGVAASRGVPCLVADRRGEASAFLSRNGFSVVKARGEEPSGFGLIVVGEGMVREGEYIRLIPAISESVISGAVLVVLEPEFGNIEKETLRLIEGVSLTIERREDTDRGGYDSYVFPADEAHPLWRGIPAAHLRMFNGALGGEIVSQHTVVPDVNVDVLARCGLNLAHPAVMSARVGKGRVIVSRIQTRGRLSGGGESGPDRLFARRVDPVACRYMLNLVTAFLPGAPES
jgi:beta-galactosidase